MDIDHPVSVGLDHLLRHDHHKACQYNEIHVPGIDSFQQCIVEKLTICILFRRNTYRFNTGFRRSLQCFCLWIIADHHFDLCIGDASIGNAVDNGLEIGAAAGYKYCNL